MKRRLIAALALVPLLAAPAHAETYCHQLVDNTNDATGFTGGQANPRGSDSGADIEWGGVATSRANVGIWMKFYSFASVDTSSPTGRRIDVVYRIRGVEKTYSVLIDARGNTSSLPVALHVKPVYDAPKFELHLSAPLSSLGLGEIKVASKRLNRPADTFTFLSITTRRWAGDLASGQQVGTDPVDTANATFAYPHLGASCVKPGQ